MSSSDLARAVRRSARAVIGLGDALAKIEDVEGERAACRSAIERGYFTPDEDRVLRDWFARYVTARTALLETINDLRPVVDDRGTSPAIHQRAFLVAYTAACMLVRVGRFLVADFATDPLVQRKLNEASPAHRLPRKLYTRIRHSLTSPRNAWRILEARNWADEHRGALEALADDPAFARVLQHLARSEEAVRLDVRSYLFGRLRYRWHAWRRRRTSAYQQALFGLAEVSGRVVAEIRSTFHDDRVTPEVVEQAAALLEPGDIIATRHDRAFSNLFLPGYWPHICLHIGSPSTCEHLNVICPDRCRERWTSERRVLEARKDGVLLRELTDTLAVDAFTIIRPRIQPHDLGRALARALEHEGKLYNFDFDFFTDDRLVCTEVVYRAYEAVGNISFPLTRRAGRVTLSAEDILRLAIGAGCFEVVAVFGTPGTGDRLVTGIPAQDALKLSMESSQDGA